jgi:hypothetical protein
MMTCLPPMSLPLGKGLTGVLEAATLWAFMP